MADIRPSLAKTYSVQYGDRQLSFCWRRRDAGGRKARIHVYPDGLVEVQTPRDTTLAQAKQALLKRAAWVSRHLRDIEARRTEVLERQYVSGETVLYLGRRYTLKVVPSSGEQHVKLLRGQVRVTTRATGPADVKAKLAQWYRDRASDVFTRRLLAVSEQAPWVEETPSWSLRTMKAQWGSCSPSGVIILNPHLVKAPTRCIDYVILHEFCHLREHNHSAGFFRLLRRVMPNWQDAKAQLDGMSELYINE